MSRLTRRDLLKHSIAAGLAVAAPRLCRAATSCVPDSGPNSQVRVGIVGMGGIDTPGNVGGRGRQLIEMLAHIPSTKIVALCDVDEALLRHEAGRCEERPVARHVPRPPQDARRQARRRGARGHARPLARAGGGVGVPGGQGRVRRKARLLQHLGRPADRGRRTQVRPHRPGRHRRPLERRLPGAFDFLRSGQIGPIRYAHAIVYRDRKSIGRAAGPTPIPATVDYDLWCGPAPMAPLTRKYLHYDWHWVWPNGSGEMGNNGVHHIDLCRWAIGSDGLPRRAMSLGGRFLFNDDGQTPNTQVAMIEFASGPPILCEVRGLGSKQKHAGFRNVGMGIIVQCEGGYLTGEFTASAVYDKQGKKIKSFSGPNFQQIQTAHVANFVEAVRTRNGGHLKAPIVEGHRSTACCHLANVSYRIGKQSNPEAIAERTRANPELADAFERCREHLLSSGVDLGKTRGVLGPWVTLDAASEQFVGDFAQEANAIGVRQPREPFVVPTIA